MPVLIGAISFLRSPAGSRGFGWVLEENYSIHVILPLDRGTKSKTKPNCQVQISCDSCQIRTRVTNIGTRANNKTRIIS